MSSSNNIEIMKAWMLLLLPLLCSANAGNLTVSNLTIYPAIKDSFNSLLYFSFSPQFPLPMQSILHLESNLKFSTSTNREDCFLTGVPGVFVSSCNSSDSVLLVRIDSLNVTEITSDMSLSLTVTDAVDLNTDEKEMEMTVETTWDSAVINRNASLAPVPIQTVPGGFHNLKISLAETMVYTLTNMTLSFWLNSTLDIGDQLILRFPKNFDSNVGMTNFRNQLPCKSVPTVYPTCNVKYYSLQITIGTSLSFSTPVTFDIKDVFMPTTMNLIQILQLNSNSSIQASAFVMPVAVQAELNLKCCITYDILNYHCDDDLRRVCFQFHFNQADFESDMNTILVRFKQVIEVESLRKQGQNCGNIFIDHTLRKLGQDPVCRWTDVDRLMIFLGAYPTITNKDLLNFHSRKIQYYNTTRFLDPPRLRLLNPRSLPSPVAVMTKTGFISGCSVVTLDCLQSTGSGRRNLKCFWTLDGYEVATGPVFQVGKSYVPEEHKNKTNYSMNVTLRVVNEWGLMNNTSGTVLYQANKDIEIIFPFGNHIRFYYSQGFVFTLMVAISSDCKGFTTDDITAFQWISSAPNFPVCDGKSCRIPARGLELGNYTLNVTSEIPGTSLYGSANITFEVSPTPIRIKTSGGNRLVQVNESVTIDGSATIDPDRLGDQKVMLQWAVNNSQAEQIYPPPGSSSQSGYVLNIPKDVLTESNARYIVIVNTTSLSGNRAPETTTLWLETTTAPVITIYTLPPPTVNPFDIVKISAVSYATPGSVCNWTQVTNHNYDMYSDPAHPIFVFKPESFDVGLKYRFQYQCESRNGNQTLIGRAEVEIYINMPPVGGVFNLQPSEGVELETTFFLTAQNWVDRDGDYPLYYQYYYLESGIYRPFSPAMLQNNFSTVLARVSDSDTPQTIVLYTCDALNACTRSSQNALLTASARASTGLIRDTLEKAGKVANISGDPRAGLTPIGQVPIYIAQSLANGNLTAEEAVGPVTAVLHAIQEASSQIQMSSQGPLSTEDQETIGGLVAVSMVPGVTDAAIAALGLAILDPIMDLNRTRYTTGPVYALALDKTQQALAVLPLTEQNIDEMANTTGRLYELTDKLSKQVVDRLTPGQFPTNISLDSAVIYAERWVNASNSSGIFQRQLSFMIETEQLNGFYNITIEYDMSKSPGQGYDEVMEMVIRALLIPPPEVLLRHLPHSICAMSFANTPDYERITVDGECRNYVITAAANITTLYPRSLLQTLPYNTSTGNISITGTSWHVESGQLVTHLLPMADYTGSVTCSAHNSKGLLDDSLCSKGPATSTSVICNCLSATDAFLSPDIDVAQAVGSPLIGGDYTPDSGEITAGTMFLIWILWISLILFIFFWGVDKSEKSVKAGIIKQFENFTREVVSYLAKYKGKVEWKQRKYLGYLCCSCLYLPASSLFRFKCCFVSVSDSLPRLFSLPLEEDNNGEKLGSAISYVVKTLSTDANLPQLHIWQEFGAMDSFKSRLSSPVFLCHIKALYFQFKTGIRDFSEGTALSRTPIRVNNCFDMFFTDDLMHYKTSLSEFVANNELLGLFLNRKIKISRKMRFPILLANFLSSVCFYSANYISYTSPNKQKLLSFGALLFSDRGKLWTSHNWHITLIIFGISVATTFILEKLLVWGSLYPSDMKEMRYRFARTWKNEKSVSIYFKCLLFRVFPTLICVGLYVSSWFFIWQLDKYDTFNIIATSFEGFLEAGVGVGFFGVGILFTLPYWLKSLYRHITRDFRYEWRQWCARKCWAGCKYLCRLLQLALEPILLPINLLRSS